MFEIVGTVFERGTFCLKLENPSPRILRPLLKLGAVGGRLLGLAFLIPACLLSLKSQPMSWLVEKGFLSSQEMALSLQLVLNYTLVGVGTLIYLAAFFLRREILELEFDRSSGVLRFTHTPRMAKLGVREGMVDFKGIEKIEVCSKEKRPLTSNGYVRILLRSHPPPYREIVFKLMSDEQFSFYPANLMRLTGITPVGDFVDPDSALT